MNRWAKGGLILITVLAAAYYWLLIDNRPGSDAAQIDIVALRQAANSIPGAKPARVEVERVSSWTVPETAMIAGTSWADLALSAHAYRAGGVIIDTTLDKAVDIFGAKDRDESAYARIQAAMVAAQTIVVTHEHLDHIGGLLGSPHWKDLAPKALITREQYDHPENSDPVKWPEGSRPLFKPLDYQQAKAIAPGVVVMKAPSHTPGSQIVFVQTASGSEYLFTGDIASLERNHTQIRARSRLVGNWMLSEDRPAVFRWLTAFNRLARAEPKIIFVPTHDTSAIDRLIAQGKIARGFSAN
jgi:glyoxylase-like metal-dependent hydrolase (beta-lactamase superfamily II)